jgi:hypothetical protein
MKRQRRGEGRLEEVITRAVEEEAEVSHGGAEQEVDTWVRLAMSLETSLRVDHSPLER